MTDTTASGRSLDPHYAEAREAFDQLNQQIRQLGFMLSGFTHVPDSGYPTFTIAMTSRQAELIEAALTQPEVMTSPDREYSRSEVSNAVNKGADLVLNDIAPSEYDRDLVNLVINAAMTLLDNPKATLDEVIAANYDEDPATVRGWHTNWGQL